MKGAINLCALLLLIFLYEKLSFLRFAWDSPNFRSESHFPRVAVTPKTMVYILATCKIVPLKHTPIVLHSLRMENQTPLRLPSFNQGAEGLVFHRINANQAHVKNWSGINYTIKELVIQCLLEVLWALNKQTLNHDYYLSRTVVGSIMRNTDKRKACSEKKERAAFVDRYYSLSAYHTRITVDISMWFRGRVG